MTATPGPTPFGVRNPGSQGALRHLNQERLVEFLLANGPSTQAELARGTGLSTATVSNIVRDMATKGVVSTSPVTSSGRRALLVQLTDTGDIAVGVDFGRRHVRIVLSTLGYQVVAEEQVALEPGYDAMAAVQEAADLLQRMLVGCGHDRESVLAVGVASPVRSTGGRARCCRAPSFPNGWGSPGVTWRTPSASRSRWTTTPTSARSPK